MATKTVRTMDVYVAIRHAYRLHEEWVSTADIRNGKGFNLNRIYASMLSELRANQRYPNRCTEACKRETKGALVLLGKVQAALSL